MAVNEHVLRQEIAQDYNSSMEIYRATVDESDPNAIPFARGQAMSHVLFRISQQFGQRVGALGSLFGNKIQKLQEEFGIEVIPFAFLPDDEAESAFVEYVIFSRFGGQMDADRNKIKAAVQKGLDANPQKPVIINDAKVYKFAWLPFIQ